MLAFTPEKMREVSGHVNSMKACRTHDKTSVELSVVVTLVTYEITNVVMKHGKSSRKIRV
jgi:predicted nuclease with TOPRIM domain